MKSLKNITRIKKKSKNIPAFSLTEAIVATSMAAFLLILVVSSSYLMHNGLYRAKKSSRRLAEMAAFSELISESVLNADIYPRYGIETFGFEKDKILFSALGEELELSFKDKQFLFKKGEKEHSYTFIKDFKIKYFDQEDSEIVDEIKNPHYAILSFKFFDQHQVDLTLFF